ncbi:MULTISPECIES: helix-turn-helix transcriptional regulator [Paenibacillus]|uniref:helix-turn-helix transcriptional regulator n=1 Tax=Paenibacillus TaxID=44249 RepID=UPI0022B93F8D|nr:YafY family protein [Paenibacillus caseinilyticus]MCZ8521168.1 YafY family protein [Paenibacillus caseinilyticus]
MPKSKRLLELMQTVNRKRKFTVKELAQEFGVSTRTMLRDLQELSELGVPLYSETGPHGGYQVLNERILPPIAFTEEEAVGIFFACHALRHYTYLPFHTEMASALTKFYHYMSGDIRERIDGMKNRIDFVTPVRLAQFPYLPVLLDAAVRQYVLTVEYGPPESKAARRIQPVGIYAFRGLWYCPAYCFLRGEIRVFRCDRMHAAAADDSGVEPVDLRHVHLENRSFQSPDKRETAPLYVELSPRGVEDCEAEVGLVSHLHRREDGTGWLEGDWPKSDLPFLAAFFVGVGTEARVTRPPELVEEIKRRLHGLLAHYS